MHTALEKYVGKGEPLPKEFEHLAQYVDRFRHFSGEKHCEMEVAITEQYKPAGWWDKDVWLRAKLDLVVIGDKTALLVDYKTGKMKDDGFTQLKLAAAMLMLFFKQIEKVTMAYLWTEHNGVVTSEVFSRSDFIRIWNELMPRLDAFERAHREHEFPPIPSGLCKRHCPVLSCPYNGQS